MPGEQKAVVVITEPGMSHGLDELNLHLGRGWRVAHLSPMGGAALGAADAGADVYFAALVILERAGEDASEVLEAIAEESDELLDELLEGDGGIELPER